MNYAHSPLCTFPYSYGLPLACIVHIDRITLLPLGQLYGFSWWHHRMETISALLALCAGSSLFAGEFPAQRASNAGLWCFFYLRLNKQLSKQSWGWWFETSSCSLWHRCNPLCTFTLYLYGLALAYTVHILQSYLAGPGTLYNYHSTSEVTPRAPSQYKDRLISVWRFLC